jgi:hypothetical protein
MTVKSWFAAAGLSSLVIVFMSLARESQPGKGKPVKEDGTQLYDKPEQVTLRGYDDDSMEPFLTRDGRYLLFNNLNQPSVNTNLHYAERKDDLRFEYKGELEGVNTPALEGVPTMDKNHALYFVSPRSYDKTFSTIYRGKFADGKVSDVELVPGISRKQPGIVNFDVDVSPDGKTLYFVDAKFANGNPVTADLVIAERREKAFDRAANSSTITRKKGLDS